ncbi:MAG: TonB-dependent receptor plug domain-containing protein [Gammaproteobacteria bacterium]|nr:TonB-dependent receptor plug domain-containing protein [Gammaproteobacteria bacterium]
MDIRQGIGLLLASLMIAKSIAYEKVEVYTLSLEELLDTKVVSASRKEEQQHLAPGVITVISEQEIKQYGARHLRDILDRLVGIQVIGSHQDFHSKTSIRAANSSHHEGQTLILLNGRPMRQATDGGLNSDLYLGFPLQSLDRIEVIRGPGSVIYGTNAMTGVINLITKDAKTSVNSSNISLTAGSFGMKQAQLSHLMGDKDYSLNIALNHFSADGDSVNGITDQDAFVGTYETGVPKSNNLFLNGRYKQFTFNALVMQDTQDSASSAFQLPSNPIDLERVFIDLGYLYQLNNDWDVSLNYSHSHDTAKWQINEAIGDNNSEGRAQLFETILRGKVNSKTNMLVGLSHVRNESGFDRGLPQNSTNSSSSAYVQFDYMPNPKQKYIAGGQWNKPKEIEADLSPRLGFIQGFGDNLWLKLLYSEAYRSPNLVETNLDAPQLKGVSTLAPENIATFDIQLTYKTPRQIHSLALYHSKLENLIVRVPGTPTTHANEGYVKFWGVELENKLEVNPQLNLQANFSYQQNKNKSGVENGTFAPQVMAKVGLNYENQQGFNFSIFNSYFGDTEDLSVTNVAPKINPEASSYNLLTANIRIDTGKLWSLGKPRHSFISLYLDNILDEEVYAADLNFANQNNTIPHHWGRGVYLSYNYKF